MKLATMLLRENCNWNNYRLAADYLHFGGMLTGLGTLLLTKSAAGFSKKTQMLFLLVFMTRYLDLLTEPQETYLVVFKVAFNAITASTLAGIGVLDDTYEAALDSCNILAILVPTFFLSGLVTMTSGILDRLWTFSEFLEPFALVPQYIMCYRAPEMRPIVIVYILCVGGYRVLYLCNWVYKRYCWHAAYHDYTSWLGGAVECVLFFDFVRCIVIRKSTDSLLGAFMLKLDDGAGKVSAAIELRTLGRRLPLGLGGAPERLPEAGEGFEGRSFVTKGAYGTTGAFAL
eukprot:TRINITY_DN65749_c0_g1_i1.p1 TRINITY_DN65749_c0_g1~~TRINITY_DN65749_c0_g1_i1.p1  ORF type:complete len:287 (+),score=63.66 TRINITY_DN65749_c0_g1_i1:123-983(+)